MTVASFSPLVLDQFQLLFSASDDVERLNQAILQLAVQGRLAQRDLSDEPASELLNRIQAEKETLGKIETSLKVKDDEKPFDLPTGWEWVRLKDLGQTQTGATPPTSNLEFFGKDYPFIKPADITENAVNYSNEGLSKLGIEKGRRIKANSILMVCIGGSIGKVGYVDQDCSCNQQINAITPYDELFHKVIFYFLKSPYFRNEVISRAPKTTLPILSKGKWEIIPLPLPPLAEQKRIVARVEELLVQTPQLAEKLAKNEQELTLLNQSALAHLLASQTPEEFETHWNFIAAHFDSLFTEPEHVAPLRQSILELAVRGKLTRREAGDESAGELLKRIKEEKEKNGKAELLLIKESEKTFDLPDGWQWARLTTIADVGTGSTPLRSNPDYFLNGTISWVTSSATNSPFISKSDELITEKAVQDTRLRLYPKHTLIVALYGQGKTRGQVSELLIEATTNQACASLVFNGEAESLRTYTKIFLIKNYREMRLLAEGGAQPNLNLNKIKQMLIPIPPLTEQERIVAKVGQLLSLCDVPSVGGA